MFNKPVIELKLLGINCGMKINEHAIEMGNTILKTPTAKRNTETTLTEI